MVSRHQITGAAYDKIVANGEGSFSRNVTELLVRKCIIRKVVPNLIWKKGETLDLVVGCLFKPIKSVRVIITKSWYSEKERKKHYEFKVVKRVDKEQLEINF